MSRLSARTALILYSKYVYHGCSGDNDDMVKEKKTITKRNDERRKLDERKSCEASSASQVKQTNPTRKPWLDRFLILSGKRCILFRWIYVLKTIPELPLDFFSFKNASCSDDAFRRILPIGGGSQHGSASMFCNDVVDDCCNCSWRIWKRSFPLKSARPFDSNHFHLGDC